MVKVDCRAGRTQIHRVLRHAINETKKRRVHAVIFIGDACEEGIDTLGDLAGQLGLLGVKAFVFHEGHDQTAAYAFQEIASLTGGAACRFDASAPAELRALLRAVAAYAAGGQKALTDYAKREGGAVRLLEQQTAPRLMTYFLVGLLLLGLGLLASRWYAKASPHDLAQGGRTFAAVFSGLASTGLLFAGRFGLALITIAATVMAIRAIRRGRRGADPMDGGPASDPVEVETDLLRMRLDRDTGDVSGTVKSGNFAGSDLESLSYGDLLALLAEAAAQRPAERQPARGLSRPPLSRLARQQRRRWRSTRARSAKRGRPGRHGRA